MTEERRDEIRKTLQFLRQTQGKVVRAFIDVRQFSNRIQFLKEKKFVLYTVDISPSCDAILEWADAVLHQEMGIRITRVRVLNKHCYLMIVDNKHDRDRILDAAPLFSWPHMVFALLWDPRFDSAKLDNCKVPVWVELPNIHPYLEAFGTQLLQSIGEVLFTSCEDTDCRFTSIQSCLKLDLSLDLPEVIKIADPDTGEMFQQPILYQSLPNACFHCHQRGHLVRNCRIRRQQTARKEDAEKMERAEQQNRDEKQKLGAGVPLKRKPTGDVKNVNPISSTNPYEVLAEEESREDKKDEEESIPSRRNDGGLAGMLQDQHGDAIETDLEPQTQHVSPPEQSPVRMEATAEKRKQGPSEKENRCGLGMTAPDGTENPAQNGTPQCLNPGQTQGNSSKKQGGKKIAS
ncbi:hypothetical protein R1flu_010938 [Riccia fluitans]|uniref:CCHC-type domain-containing protein n=1 Tax=Riccia fluitans TaxID=41844 RepID=A0ABD1Z6R4_9MARC